MTASRHSACLHSDCDVINWLLRHSRTNSDRNIINEIGKRMKYIYRYTPIHAENKMFIGISRSMTNYVRNFDVKNY